jgi:hypothetical protein
MLEQRFPNCGAFPPRGADGPLGVASCLYEGHIYFERNIGERQNIYLIGTLLDLLENQVKKRSEMSPLERSWRWGRTF